MGGIELQSGGKKHVPPELGTHASPGSRVAGAIEPYIAEDRIPISLSGTPGGLLDGRGGGVIGFLISNWSNYRPWNFFWLANFYTTAGFSCSFL